MATFDVGSRTTPPAVDIYIAGLPAGTYRVRLYRQWNGKSQRVRSDDQAAVISGGARLEDYDVPLGTPVTYRVRAYAVSGSELAVSPNTSAAVTIDGPAEDVAWLSDPIAPVLSLPLQMLAGSDAQRTYASSGSTAKVLGSSYPVAITEARTSASGWSFQFKAPDFDTAAALEALLLPGGVLLLRADPTVVQHPTGLIYLAAPSVTRDNTGYQFWSGRERSAWTLQGDSVRPPAVGTIMPTREYANVRAEATTYQGLKDLHDDYLSVLRGNA